MNSSQDINTYGYFSSDAWYATANGLPTTDPWARFMFIPCWGGLGYGWCGCWY